MNDSIREEKGQREEKSELGENGIEERRREIGEGRNMANVRGGRQ